MSVPLRVDLLVAEDPPQHGVALLAQAHRTLGHDVRVVHLRKAGVMAGYRPTLPGRPADIAHSRVSALWGLDVQDCLVNHGYHIVNSPRAQRAGRDKWLCSKLLLAAGLPVLPTALVPPGADAESLVSVLGGDLVLKPLTGHSGNGVIRRTGEGAIRAALEEESALRIAQPYAEAGGRDERLITVGERVVAAYQRSAPRGDFRANSALPGSTLMPVVPTANKISLALRAARACELDIAGVDILTTEDGTSVILEVNTNCGIVTGLQTLTGQDVAVEMARHVAERARR